MFKYTQASWHFFVILLAILLLRGSTLGLSVIDWDETAYALVARDILSGFWPYTTSFDHKPAALYYHFTALMAVFGDNPTSTRMVSLLCVLGSSLVLRSLLVDRLKLSPVSGTIFVLLFIVACSGLNGATSNTEHIINFYTLAWIWATYKALDGKPLYFVLTGILMGISFHSNYLTGFIMVGYSLGFIAAVMIREGDLLSTVKISLNAGSLALVGFVGSSFLVLLPIMVWGNIGEYFTLQQKFISGYDSNEGSFWAARGTLKLFVPLFFIMLFFAYKFLFSHEFTDERRRTPCDIVRIPVFTDIVFLTFLLLGAMGATAGSGRFYPHYFLFSVPALMLVMAALFKAADLSRDARYIAFLFLAGAFLTLGAQGQYYAVTGAKELLRGIAGKEPLIDKPRIIAAHVSPLMKEGDSLYVTCAQPVLYQLLDARPLTRYSYYLHHFSEDYTTALGITVSGEVDRILNQNPGIVILGTYENCFPSVKQSDWQYLADQLDMRNYHVATEIDGHLIYQSTTGR